MWVLLSLGWSGITQESLQDHFRVVLWLLWTCMRCSVREEKKKKEKRKSSVKLDQNERELSLEVSVRRSLVQIRPSPPFQRTLVETHRSTIITGSEHRSMRHICRRYRCEVIDQRWEYLGSIMYLSLLCCGFSLGPVSKEYQRSWQIHM